MSLASRITTNQGERMNARIPAEVFPPGEYLADELEARNWSQTELAEILGRPARLVNEIIAGKRAITPETAKGLSAAFGSSPEFWMNLETAYQLSKARIADTEVARRARLYGTFPVKEIIKRGWVESSENIEVLEQRFLDHYKMKSMDGKPSFAYAGRQTTYSTPADMLKLGWLRRAEKVAETVRCPKYSDKALRAAIPQLRACMEYKDGIEKVSAILAEAGVRIVIVEHLPSQKMDGACFWINNKQSPVIALSLRYDRIDNFWFNLSHEIDHILHGEGKDDPIYELIEPGTEGLPPNEIRANKAGADYCIPKDEMENFIARMNLVFSKSAIIGFAARMHVHPGIVVGQLQGRKPPLLPYSHHREMLEKIKDVATARIITDGFGNSISL